MKIIKFKDQKNPEVLERSKLDAEGAMDAVRIIIEAVKEKGDIALKEFTEKFDTGNGRCYKG